MSKTERLFSMVLFYTVGVFGTAAIGFMALAYAGIVASPPVPGPVPGSQIVAVDIISSLDGGAVGTFQLNGYLHKIVSVPDVITTPAVFPLAGWDCVVIDKWGQEIATGALIDRINTLAQTSRPYAIGTASFHSPMLDGWHRMICTNMGTTRHANSYFMLQDKPGP